MSLKEKQFKQLESICSTLQSFNFTGFKSMVKITLDNPELVVNLLRIICDKSDCMNEYIEFLYFKKLRNLIVEYATSLPLNKVSKVIEYLIEGKFPVYFCEI